MLDRISVKVTDSLIQSEIISNDDRELYRYGVDQLLSYIVNFVTALVIGLLLNSVVQVIIFVFMLMLLRSYAGGYHARTQLRCYIATTATIVISTIIANLAASSALILIAMLAISSITIFILSPVEDANKPLDDIETRVYRRRTRIILIIGVISSLGLLALDFQKISSSIITSIFVVGLMVLLGFVKNKLEKRRSEMAGDHYNS